MSLRRYQLKNGLLVECSTGGLYFTADVDDEIARLRALVGRAYREGCSENNVYGGQPPEHWDERWLTSIACLAITEQTNTNTKEPRP